MTRSRDTASIIPTVDAKGDLLVGTADNTIDNLSPGTNGQLLTANSATATGLEWTTPASSGNAIINGAFDIWQRGTTVTHSQDPLAGQAYTADRFQAGNVRDGVAWRSITVSRSTNAPAGFQYSAKITTGANDVNRLQFSQVGEAWNYLTPGPATLSFYIRRIATADSSAVLRTEIGSSSIETWGSFNDLSTTQFTRITRTVPSITGSTLIRIQINTSSISTPILTSAGDLFEITGVQLEAGSVATPFRRNANSLQGELAACQRYYFRWTALNVFTNYAEGYATSTATLSYFNIQPPVEMRASPTSVEFSNIAAARTLVSGPFAVSACSLVSSSLSPSRFSISTTHASSGHTAFTGQDLVANNTTSSFLGFSAEL